MSGPRAGTKYAISSLSEDFGDGFTPIPTVLLDWFASILTEGELRVLCYICRRTFGFGKQSDRISLSQLCDGVTSRSGVPLDLGTGMSRQGVLNAVGGLQGKGILDCMVGRGRGQVNEYRIRLSAEAWDRVYRLESTMRERVNTVDPLRRPPARRSPRGPGARKGQRPTGEKVNMSAKSSSEKVYAVDPQERVNTQERGIQQQKVGSAQNELLPPKNHSEEHDLEGRLESITGQRLAAGERRRFRALRWDREGVSRILDTFSTESYWADLPKKNAAFLRYLQDVPAEESTRDYMEEAARVAADWE